MDDTTLMIQAVSTYVLYRTVHHLRHRRDPSGAGRQQYVQHYMDQTLHEACRGCARFRNVCQRASGAPTLRRQREEGPAARRRIRRRVQ